MSLILNNNSKEVGEESQNWLKVLPRDSAAVIRKKIKNQLSLRQIIRILNGETKMDKHGILLIAAKIAKEESKKKERLKEDYSNLSSSLPNKK